MVGQFWLRPSSGAAVSWWLVLGWQVLEHLEAGRASLSSHRVSKLLLAQASCLTFFKAVRIPPKEEKLRRFFLSLLGHYHFQLEMCMLESNIPWGG